MIDRPALLSTICGRRLVPRTRLGRRIRRVRRLRPLLLRIRIRPLISTLLAAIRSGPKLLRRRLGPAVRAGWRFVELILLAVRTPEVAAVVGAVLLVGKTLGAGDFAVADAGRGRLVGEHGCGLLVHWVEGAEFHVVVVLLEDFFRRGVFPARHCG